jgi:F1F0 ATPase subunit 2
MDREAMTIGIEAVSGLPTALTFGGALAVGAVGGAVYYHTLWRTVRLITIGRAAFAAAALQLARLMLITMMLAMVAHFGGAALLAAMLGILASRLVVLHSCGGRR